MARNKKPTGSSRRYNVSQETLERARAEMRGEVATTDEAVVSTRKSTSRVQIYPSTPGTAPASAAVKSSAKRAPLISGLRKIPTIPELQEEYRYVNHELRNLAIIAVVLLAGVFVAALLLPRPV